MNIFQKMVPCTPIPREHCISSNIRVFGQQAPAQSEFWTVIKTPVRRLMRVTLDRAPLKSAIVKPSGTCSVI